MQTNQGIYRNRIIGLDSLRFFAFLSIFIYHSIPGFKYGYLGVDFFFVLSSFLLTYLALREIKTTGHFSKRNFFMRRVLRIFPLYYLVIIFSFLALPQLAHLAQTQVTLPDKKYLYWFFLSNYDTGDSIFALKFLWSIAVEEQFYLLFIAMSFLFRKHIWVFITALMIVYVGFMLYTDMNDLSFYPNTMAHFANFALGMTAGYIFYYNKLSLKWSFIIFSISLLALLITLQNALLFNFIISISFASLILIAIKQAHHVKDLALFKYTERLGKYTYGLYVYSGFVLTFAYIFIPIENNVLMIFIELMLTILIATVSYEFFERRFLNLKKNFRHQIN